MRLRFEVTRVSAGMWRLYRKSVSLFTALLTPNVEVFPTKQFSTFLWAPTGCPTI